MARVQACPGFYFCALWFPSSWGSHCSVSKLYCEGGKETSFTKSIFIPASPPWVCKDMVDLEADFPPASPRLGKNKANWNKEWTQPDYHHPSPPSCRSVASVSLPCTSHQSGGCTRWEAAGPFVELTRHSFTCILGGEDRSHALVQISPQPQKLNQVALGKPLLA